MNNKPVAWMNAHTGHLCSGGFLMTKMQDYIPLYTHPTSEVIYLTKAEIESGLSRVKWAELLIKQLPEEHEGRNSWLLNYGDEK